MVNMDDLLKELLFPGMKLRCDSLPIGDALPINEDVVEALELVSSSAILLVLTSGFEL